ncbi:hypothetical protein [Natrinema versiforme]|uniref:Flagellin n=1 Tax=Natrinema versiforme TaxID=88724 RepID=A0A4P8WIJ7_9EURY|nr:hypothetical protein [Natrinema versiforme]QCS41681.1 hypothetical protein FEJ81_04665 [Natrinema versiforme]
MTGERECLHKGEDEERGASPQVGLVLLFGIVAISAVLLITVGMGLIGSIESESQVEQTRTSMDVMDHGFSTVINTKQQQEVPVEDAQFEPDGTVYVAWVNNRSTAFDNNPNATIDPLGRVESKIDGQTIAYQGGGIWEQTADGTTVYSAPDIHYDQSLTMNVVQVDASDINGDNGIAEINDSKSDDLAAEIENSSKQSNGTDLALEIKSEYHEGWKQHFESALKGDVDIDHDPDEKRVRVYIEDARSDATFQVTDVEADRVVPRNGELEVNASVLNVGDAYGTGNLTLAVNPETKTEIELEPGETTTESLTLPVNAISEQEDNLSQYKPYTYNVSTSDDYAQGRFFLSYPNTSYYKLNNSDIDINQDPQNQTISLEAGFLNIGETDEPRNVSIDLQGDQQVRNDQGDLVDISWESVSSVEQQPWNDSTIATTINRSALPDGEYELTVAIDNPTGICANNNQTCEVTRNFTIDGGGIGDPGEVIVSEPANVSTSIIGTEISAEGDFNRITSPFTDNADAGLLVNDGSKADGSVVRQESGNFGFSLVPSEPESTNDEPKTSSSGGWVAADGTTPEADGEVVRNCYGRHCERNFEGEWNWDVNKLVWSEDGGYVLDWHQDGDWSWDGDGSAEVAEFDQYKQWAPVTASAMVNGSEVQLTPAGENNTLPVDEIDEQSMADHNLNTFGTQDQVWNYEQENVTGTVSISSTYWSCNEWDYAGVDKSDATGTDSNYYNRECTDFGTPITTAEGGGYEAESETGFVMTRDADHNNLPEIEEGYPRQRNVTEVFKAGTDGVTLDEENNLTLGPRDFAFMMEVTMDQDGLQDTYGHNYNGEYDLYTDNQSELFRAAWDIAENYRDEALYTNDPNYNDVIGFVQVDGGGTYVDLEDDPFDDVHVNGELRETNIRGGGTIETDPESGTVSVNAGSITIR